MLRRLKRLVIAAVVAAAALAVGGKFALRSAYAAQQATARLQTAVGAPVRVGNVDLGFTGSALHGFDVLETTSTAQPPAWVTVGSVQADLSLWQLVRGDLGGGAVVLRDVHVTLAFDSKNRLLTRLPVPPPGAGPLPVVRLEGGKFTFRKEGLPDEVFHNIQLELRSGAGGQLALSGTIHDPDWGEWAVGGGQDAWGAPFTLNLRTAQPVHVTPALLRRAPFVPPNTWRHVECEGVTPADVTVRFAAGAPRTHYRVVLDPRDTNVHVAAIDLRAEAASGRVVVEDDVVVLEGVKGRAAGGKLLVGSRMDFAGPVEVLQFQVAAELLNPRLLPERWHVPPIQGQVSGSADLTVTIRDGRASTSGRGDGKVQAFPLLRPISLHMESDGRGFRFSLGRG